MTSSPLFQIEHLNAGYGESIVLSDVYLDVQQGEIVSLLGPNGAGKTTTMMAITGLLSAYGGTIRLDGHPITDKPAHKRVDLGVALSPEGRQVFPDLNVEENLLLGSFASKARASRPRNLTRVYDLFPRLAERKRQLAGLMSGGEQQMLAIGRALMSEPRLLLLDEPSLGLSPLMTELVYDTIPVIAAEGISILLVEQNTEASLAVSNRAYVLSHGRIVAAGKAEDLRDSAVLRDAFFGGALSGAAQ